MEEKAGFLKSLFDFSFSHFITTKIIKFLYGISIAFGGLAALFLFIDGIKSGFGRGRSTAEGILILIGLLILIPLLFLLYAMFMRVYLEVIIVIFRIAEHTSEIAKQGRKEEWGRKNGQVRFQYKCCQESAPGNQDVRRKLVTPQEKIGSVKIIEMIIINKNIRYRKPFIRKSHNYRR